MKKTSSEDDRSEMTEKKLKPHYEKKDRDNTLAGSKYQPTKAAKFSSLFKNNQEIPRVGE